MLTTRLRGEPDVDRAWILADSVEALAPGPRKEFFKLNSQMLVGGVLARAKQADSARAVVGRSLGNPEINPTRDLALYGAFVYAQLGDKDKAIDQLKVYFAANENLRAGYAQNPGWWFRGLASDPAYQRLVGAQ
jgi:hypothetical protein